MSDKKSGAKDCSGEDSCCCTVMAIIPVDGRGQIVLPKEIREKAEIAAGDRLAMVAHEAEGKICCISLFKSDELSELVKSKLGPLMRNVFE